MRAAFVSKAGVRNGQEAGALRCLWSGSSWPKQRKYDSGLAMSPLCAACGKEGDTHSHRWCRCDDIEQILNTTFENDEEGNEDSRKVKLQKAGTA